MRVKRTACAGVLLTLDDKQILLDGVCREVKPYPATPPAIRQELMSFPPDALLLTHAHADHYDEAFVSRYCETAAGPILGPADIPYTNQEAASLGAVKIRLLESRHIGKVSDVRHCSFILEGSRCLWFLGDSSPLQWESRPELPRPDVMVVPYAYAIGSGWDLCRKLGAKAVVLLHLPDRAQDCYGLWEAVEATVGKTAGPALFIPAMGESISLAL